MTSGVEATASNRENRAVISDAASRSASATARSTVATAAMAEVQLAGRPSSPGAELIVGRRAGRQVRRIGRRRGERSVEPGHQRPQVLGDVGCPLEGLGARGRDEPPPVARPSPRTRPGVGDVRLQHRDGRDAVLAGDDLGPAGEAWHALECGVLAQVRGQLEVRVEARLEPSIGLEQQPLAEHRPTCSTGPARGPLIGGGDGAGSAASHRSARPGDGRQTSAAQRRRGRGPSPSRVMAAIVLPGDRARQGTPPAVAVGRLAEAAFRGREQDRVPVVRSPRSPARTSTSASAVGAQRERVREARGRRDHALRRVPAAAARTSRSRSRTAASTAARSMRQMPVLIVMCFTTV